MKSEYQINKFMKERVSCVGGIWKDEGNGYFSLIGNGSLGKVFSLIGNGSLGKVAYISLPENHKDVGIPYSEIDAPVNGGLTYATHNIFGWDYQHFQNFGTPEQDIKKALLFFRKRGKARK